MSAEVSSFSPQPVQRARASTIKAPVNDGSDASRKFDIVAAYHRQLEDDEITMPIAAVLALTELITISKAETMFQLLQELNLGANTLKASTTNPISLTAGAELYIRYCTTARQEQNSFTEHKASLAKAGFAYANGLAFKCREMIAEQTLGFIPDEAVILTHSYSRVVIHALLHAHKRRRISVFVTEARPRGLGVRAYDVLTAAGVPCSLILDSAVAYVMDKIDLVLLGSEAVAESGGLINAVGSYQMAIVTKAANKPLYALAESYKFLRSFPLSQYDIPTANAMILKPQSERLSSSQPPRGPSLDQGDKATSGDLSKENPATPTLDGGTRTTSSNISPSSSGPFAMSAEQIAANPLVDYTRPELITNVVSDVGILAVSAVSQYLVSIYAD